MGLLQHLLFLFLAHALPSFSVYLGLFSSTSWIPEPKHVSMRSQKASFIVALNIPQESAMIEELLSVSSPNSEKYGNYLSLDEIRTKFGPSNDDLGKVVSFFKTISGALVEPNINGDLVIVTAMVDNIERVLQTELSWFHHPTSTKIKALRSVSPLRIPDHLSKLIAFVSLNSPIVHPNFVRSRNDQKSTDKKASTSFPAVNPSTLKSLYNLPSGKAVRHGSNQSVAEFYREFYSNQDLATFLAAAGLVGDSIPIENVYGDLANNPGRPGGEANLDVQYMMAVAQGIPTYFYSMSDLNPYSQENEGFLAYLWTVGNQTYPPLVHSLSYGDDEAVVFDPARPGAIEYGLRMEMEFVKMGLRGLSVLFASGDYGAGNFDTGSSRCSKAWPDWPASSPFITSVGGTQLSTEYLPLCTQSSCTGYGEVVCSGGTGGTITSGGGFSNVHDRAVHAPWQVKAVDQYFASASNLPESSFFNTSGRGYPDVSALSSSYYVIMNGRVSYEAGTSASTPVVAAIIALLNEQRLAADLPPMGFLNPFLYSIFESHPEAFNDVTVGNNGCGVGGGNCCSKSFHASPGWDAATGLGSLNYKYLLPLALKYGSTSPASSK